MLVAYIDEFGHDGAYINDDHPKFKQHPAFGYGGYIIPADKTREMGALFKRERNILFSSHIQASSTPHQWERKGNEFFSTGSIDRYPEYTRVFKSLITQLRKLGGHVFYYGDEKPVGTVKQTDRTSRVTAEDALRETINRLCRHADVRGEDLLIVADSITDKTRQEIAAQMYAHIFSRSQTHQDMRRIIDVPLHIESKLNTNIQFADWICGLLSRASHYQLVRDSQFSWAPQLFEATMKDSITYESKLHRLHADELHGDDLFKRYRKSFKPLRKGSVGSNTPELVAFYDSLKKH